jgi:hypothetical protein
MQRRSTSQDISWFLDTKRANQLDLNPPYQRRSVWNLKDRRFFLDTVFRGYPCPPIFLHKKIDADQKTLYAVVDGKQRLQTLFLYTEGELALGSDFGNDRLNDKKWEQLTQAEREIFWNYVIPVEFLTFDEADPQEVNQAFDRLNRNMRRLEAQELRHARWDGWFIKLVETQCEDPTWRHFGIVTNARAKRMKDAQFMSELLLVLIESKQFGFDQQMLDAAYAKYDDLDEVEDVPINPDEVNEKLENAKDYLLEMQETNEVVRRHANTLAAFYTLWAAVVLHRDSLPDARDFANLFREFREKTAEIEASPDNTVLLQGPEGAKYRHAAEFISGYRGASTDLGPRAKRLEALLGFIRGE